MIEISNLKKSYGGLNVLDNISLKIDKGEIYGLVGTSGAGKSTLLNCINRLESFEEGSIKVDGQSIENLDDKEIRKLRKNMGMIFQSFSLIGRKTVYQNIAIPMECWGFSKSDIKKRVEELSEIVGLKDKLNFRPSELSGGQKQRVAIARALTMRPEYLLCDECTSALDPKTTLSILNLLENIRKELGITIVLVTHEMDVVQRLCDRMSILDGGKLSISGKVSDIFLERPSVLRKLLGESPDSSSMEGCNLAFSISSNEEDRYILWDISREMKYSLVDSQTYYFQSQKHQRVTINIEDSKLKLLENYLDSKNVKYKIV